MTIPDARIEALERELAAARALLEERAGKRIPCGRCWDCRVWNFLASQPPSVSGGAAPTPAAAPETPPERCRQCDDVLTLSCPGGCELPERCESGCEGPVTHHDVDGVPLCESCWDELAKDAPINPVRSAEPVSPSGPSNDFLKPSGEEASPKGDPSLTRVRESAPSAAPGPVQNSARAASGASRHSPEPATPPTPDPGVSGAADKYLPLCRACASWGEFVDWCDADVNDRQPRPCSRCGRATWFEFRAERAANAAPPPVQPPGDGEGLNIKTRRCKCEQHALLKTCPEIEAIRLATTASRARAEALREAEKVVRERAADTLPSANVYTAIHEAADALARLASAVPGTPGEDAAATPTDGKQGKKTR